MNATVELTVPMPADLAQLSFPKSLDDRLHYLLDEQGRHGQINQAERDEAEGLAKMASLLTLLKLGAEVRSLNT
jgi:hypothetical protein